jgi:uncharacterized protein (DUF433 family)
VRSNLVGYYYPDYWRNPEPTEAFKRGVLSSRLVSRLSGATMRQLGYWHRAQRLTATAGGRRGVGRLYSWIEYSNARATIKLLRMGLPHARVRRNIDWLEVHLPRWYEIPLANRNEGAASAPGDGIACDARAMGSWIAGNLERDRPSMIEGDTLARMIEALDMEGPLGIMAEYGDAVSMDPAVLGGVPVMRGTRIETGLLAAAWHREQDTGELAARFDVDPWRLKRVLEFEMAFNS